MTKRSTVLLSALLLLLVASAPQAQQAQQQPQYPMLDALAQKVITKYQTSTCVQLAVAKSEKPTGEQAAMEQRFIQLMKDDPQARKYFIDKVAGPMANKMFECGMIP